MAQKAEVQIDLFVSLDYYFKIDDLAEEDVDMGLWPVRQSSLSPIWQA